MKRFLIIIVFLCKLCYGGDAFAFLDFGIGSRALSMGCASVASVNDATAVFWNPAKVAVATHKIISGFFLVNPLGNWSLPGDQNISFSFVQPIRKSSGLGITVYQFRVGDIEYRKSENDIPTIINTTQNVLYLAYARFILNDLAMGLKLKYYNQSFSEIENYRANSHGFSFDFGLYFCHSQYLNLGLIYQPSAQISWNDVLKTKDFVTAKANLGICYSLFGNFILEADVCSEEDRPFKICLGGEYSYRPFGTPNESKGKSSIGLKLRAGIKDLSFECNRFANYGITSGAGINSTLPLGEISLDYAVIARVNDWGISHALSFNIMF
ncbi:MAG: hypothetical protein ABIK31_03070 [candidate division WOR-3 bacterium]